ncbi:EscT/YscT/HrcT family type III secretion system export apparatus protein [Chlamydia pecorum]|uniref:YopT tranlocation T n=2 Tax=Chlamydia pecorum TaxID=85991 RepID=A0AA34RCK1_CHLPE|nr:EscT/YscT/HrcT family type III secretion system export apparatus protein [Chlamydia pecorum]AEB41231.1 YopT tranlocation T [Chlamydia pecorum E58]AGW39292.1 type III secretion system protein [Chlamydia pecorum W73]KTF28998.1 bacterial export protein [Chlamydia pecorum]KZN27405.1 bacterial export protein [Chlamydia pecorum]KZN28065.1 bacterial export protein [Chlamydia pecorum]
MGINLPELVSHLGSAYLDYIFKLPPAYVWSVFLLLLARLLPIFSIVPFLGAKLFPSPIKIGIGLSWLAIIFPKVLMDTRIANYTNEDLFYILLIKEMIIGIVIGFILAFPFYAAQSAGSFITNQQGIQGLEGSTSPISIEQTSPHGIFYHYFVTIAFWSLGGHRIIFSLLLQSLEVIPIHNFFPPQLMSLHAPIWSTLIKICQLSLIMTIQLSAPAALAMLMSDLFLGIINRMAPQVQVIYLLSALKAFMGLLFLTLAWWFIIKQIDYFTLAWFKEIPMMLFGSKPLVL